MIGFKVLIFGVFLYGGALLYLYLYQRSLLYHPSHSTPANEGFFLDIGEEKIWTERIHPNKEKAILYFPGNTENYWINSEKLGEFFPDFTIYFLHYPGYGASTGSPSQERIFEAAEALYDRVRLDHTHLVSFGRSLGTSPALRLAAERSVDALILTTPFDSIVHLGQKRYPLFPIALLLKDPYKNILYAPKVSCPTLILLAEKDRVVPDSHSEALIASFVRTVPERVTLPDSDHTSIIDHPDYAPMIRAFLSRALQPLPASHSRASAKVSAKTTSTPERRSNE